MDKNSIAICIHNKSKLQNQILIPKQFQTCLQSSKFEIVEAPSHSHFVVIYISTLLNLHASKFQGAKTIIDTMVLLCAFVSTSSNLHASRFEILETNMDCCVSLVSTIWNLYASKFQIGETSSFELSPHGPVQNLKLIHK